eukprot:CAMPEP_0117831230 /NCGR_PEP_ID=MMETSP0949-20121206/8971_1 /TAXON_ID=44440 /ORGANISM="Chattonella subsalsa, Strain CCMP2191" /LENGTH=324 /DNA_ID=CAMNT_0005672399 /DNA_START=94 /DNA_END=1068 /DNA_ORIENTATION=+
MCFLFAYSLLDQVFALNGNSFVQRHRHCFKPSTVHISLGQGLGHQRKSASILRRVSRKENADEYDYHIPTVPIHPDLKDVVIKHVNNLESYLINKPIAAHTRESYQSAVEFVRNFYAEQGCYDPEHCKVTGKLPVVLDSGCGTGTSSAYLADQNPLLPVIGVDRSEVRLSKNKEFRDSERERSQRRNNLLLLRGELSDFWRLIDTEEDWIIVSHNILYPNPYVKPQQMKSRFHGHPVFPILLKIGGYITVRSNWKTYVDEFAKAVEVIDDYLGSDQNNFAKKYRKSVQRGIEIYVPDVGITNFERKYIEAKEKLYQIVLRNQEE